MLEGPTELTCDAAPDGGHVDGLPADEAPQDALQSLRVAAVADRPPQTLLREGQLARIQPPQEARLV